MVLGFRVLGFYVRVVMRDAMALALGFLLKT
jgi:hypothetical protein